MVSADLLTASSSDSDESDSDLIQRCLQGDSHSFRQLYRRHQQKIRSLLFQLCGPTALDDLVQDVFLRIWKGLPKMQQKAKFSTWAYRIAWNVAADYRRGAVQGRSRLQIVTQYSPKQQEAPDWTQLHYQDLVQRGLNQLSFEHRAVLVLHDLQDIPQKEIAEILQIPVGTVKSRVFHARTAVRQFLQQEGVSL